MSRILSLILTLLCSTLLNAAEYPSKMPSYCASNYQGKPLTKLQTKRCSKWQNNDDLDFEPEYKLTDEMIKQEKNTCEEVNEAYVICHGNKYERSKSVASSLKRMAKSFGQMLEEKPAKDVKATGK